MTLNKIKPSIYLVPFFIFLSCQNNSSNRSLKRIANEYYQAGKYPEAKKAYDSLIRIDPSVGQYYGRRAYCLAVLGEFDLAKKDYIKASKFDYDKKNVYFSLGMIYEFYREYDSAIYYFDKSIKEDPNFLRAKREKDKMVNLIKMERTHIN